MERYKNWIWLTIFGWLSLTTVQAQDVDPAAMRAIRADLPPIAPLERARVEAAGVAWVSGKHLLLLSDWREPERLEDLVATFDAAVPQWCQEFSIPVEKAKGWKLRAMLIADRSDLSRFERAGLLPPDLPEFAAGFQRNHECWLFAQPGRYYTRHLLLHEGTHGFMQWFTGGYGAPWYSEGVAERLALHRWQDGQLQLGYRVSDREEVEYWGRMKTIRTEYAAGQALTLEDVLRIPPNAFSDVRYYAWSWAGVEFLRAHPASREVFQSLAAQTSQPAERFDQALREPLKDDWADLSRDWQLMIDEMDYGYDVARGVMASVEARRTPTGQANLSVAVDRGWQQTDLQVRAGDRLKLVARGKYQVGKTVAKAGDEIREYPWVARPNGVTIHYYRGRPLGELQLAILGDLEQPNWRDAFRRPVSVGQGLEFQADRDGRICFRINESPAGLADNRGPLEVAVEFLE